MNLTHPYWIAVLVPSISLALAGATHIWATIRRDQRDNAEHRAYMTYQQKGDAQ